MNCLKDPFYKGTEKTITRFGTDSRVIKEIMG